MDYDDRQVKTSEISMDNNSDNVLWDVAACLWTLLGIGVLLLPFFLALWLNSPASNGVREWAGIPQVKVVKTVKPKTITCKTLDDESDTKECKITLDDGRVVTCIVDGDDKSCDWAHAKPKDTKYDSQHRMK